VTFLAKDMQSGDSAFAFHDAETDGATLQYDAASQELLFSSAKTASTLDLMRGVVDLTRGDEATLENIQPVRATRYGEPFGSISPDRKWIVANSNETGRWELYLSTYPDIAQRIQISSTGGEEPRWTEDGSRVIYRWNDKWFEVDVTTEPALAVSPPRVVAQGAFINVPGYSWDMTSSGERFLFLEGPQQDTPIRQLQVITNFDTELNRLVPSPE
jgi:hypothetical protein